MIVNAFMDTNDKGQPSGSNKNEGLGLRPDMPAEKIDRDQHMTDRYTSDEDEPAEDLPLRHPNRNTGKNDATNAGGYKQ
jgi:hypothetical protein